MKPDNRRNFLGKLTKSILDVGIDPSDIGDPPKHKLLTKDGRLVEVSQHILQNSDKIKATREDISQWVNLPNNDDDGQ